MSVSTSFKAASSNQPKKKKTVRRPAPFSLRLTQDERERLVREAAGAPLGTYIKAKALGDKPIRMRRTGLSIEDKKAHAKVLALLGRSRLSSNLNQLTHAVNIGALPVTPETEAELFAALQDIREIHQLLIASLGLKPGESR